MCAAWAPGVRPVALTVTEIVFAPGLYTMVALPGVMSPRPGSTAWTGYRPSPVSAGVRAMAGVPRPPSRMTSSARAWPGRW